MSKQHRSHMSEANVRKYHGLYLCGMSLEKVAQRAGITRQWLWLYFKQWSLPTRPKKQLSRIEYKGKFYTFCKHNNYYRCTDGDRHRLHTRIWEENYGELPTGFEITWRDGNHHNNNVDNLMLLPTGEAARSIRRLRLVQKDKTCGLCKHKMHRGEKEPLNYFNKRIFCSKECRYKYRVGKKRGGRYVEQ